jgi:hypothetical protein
VVPEFIGERADGCRPIEEAVVPVGKPLDNPVLNGGDGDIEV